MPFLIRIIAQRVLIYGLAFLTFLGVSPEIVIPTEAENVTAVKERQEIVNQILSEQEKINNDPTVFTLNAPTKPLAVIDSSLLPIATITKKAPSLSVPTLPTKTAVPTLEGLLSPERPEITQPAAEKTEVVAVEKTPESTISNILFNIVCTQRSGTRVTISTGSGVLISEKGVVLTNAHVAQLFLLENYSREGYMDCSLRRENIPTYGFRADVLYISKDWIRENASVISNPSPRGTGENDYALLLITKNTNPALPLPDTFPSAEMNATNGAAQKGDSVTVTGYPGIQASLLNLNSSSRLLIDRTVITNVFTFALDTIDVFSTGNTPVAARGSSGGGLFEDSELIGIISTTGSNNAGSFVNAITLSYINRALRRETGYSLNTITSGDVRARADDFKKNEAPGLLRLLEQYL